MAAIENHVPAAGPPEPDLTPQEMIARAVALRPKLIAAQAETEERTYYSEELHRDFLDAGFYRLYVPRRYGGYEFDVPTFMRCADRARARLRVDRRGASALASAHALQIASWWEEQAQAEIFGDGDFRAASVAAPIGPATRSGDGLGAERQGRLLLGDPVLDALHGAGADRRRGRRRPSGCCCSSLHAASSRCSTTGARCSA